MDAQQKWLTRRELSARWNVAHQTLAQWAVTGSGPRFAKFGRQVRYAIADVEAYEAASLARD